MQSVIILLLLLLHSTTIQILCLWLYCRPQAIVHNTVLGFFSRFLPVCFPLRLWFWFLLFSAFSFHQRNWHFPLLVHLIPFHFLLSTHSIISLAFIIIIIHHSTFVNHHSSHHHHHPLYHIATSYSLSFSSAFSLSFNRIFHPVHVNYFILITPFTCNKATSVSQTCCLYFDIHLYSIFICYSYSTRDRIHTIVIGDHSFSFSDLTKEVLNKEEEEKPGRIDKDWYRMDNT